MLELVIATVGWIGAGLILLSYLLLSLDRLPALSVAYQGLNIAGALCFVVNSGWHGAMPSAVLNVIWTGIGVYALTRIVAGRRSLATAPKPAHPE